MNWFYAKNGAQEGPVSTEVLKAKLDSGEVAPSDLAWREGLPDWMPLGRIPEFSPPATPAPVAQSESFPAPAPASYSPQPQPQSQPSAYATSPAPAPVSYGAPVAKQSSGLAIASLLCALLCWPLGIAAVIMGHIARSQAKKDPARYGGAGIALAGLIIGYLTTIVFVAFVGFFMYVGSMSQAEQESFKWVPFVSEQQREEIRTDYLRKKAEREKPQHSTEAPSSAP